MHLEVTAGPAEITRAINHFPATYHADFSAVRGEAKRYVEEQQPDRSSVVALVRALRRALVSWGAGKRKAPGLRSEEEITATLLGPSLHASLSALAKTPLSSLAIARDRRVTQQARGLATSLDVDTTLLSALRELSDQVFLGNTNVTYPMKTVLLITGFMPAFDSQVRRGLGNAGFAGMDATRFLLPSDSTEAGAKKITRLPFLLGQCWSEQSSTFEVGVTQSKFPQLINEPGRVFDILLFMQGSSSYPLFVLHPPGRSWYNLL